MTMDDDIKTLLSALKASDEIRDEVLRRLEAAWAARTNLDERVADLRDTVSQLQQEVRTLREKLKP